jgi:hypothetical protein
MFKPPPFRVADRTPRRPSFLKKERARRRAYPSCSLPWASARPPFLWGADAHVGAASAEFHVEMARSRGGAVSTKPHRHFPNPACSCHTPLSSWRCVVGGLQGAAAARQPPTFGVRGPGRTAPPSDPGIPSSGDFASVQSEVRPLPARCPLAPSRFSRAGAIVRLWTAVLLLLLSPLAHRKRRTTWHALAREVLVRRSLLRGHRKSEAPVGNHPSLLPRTQEPET